MHCRYLVFALPFVAAVVYAVMLGKSSIAAFRPRCPPFLDPFCCVPVVVVLLVALVLLAPRLVNFLEDTLPVLVKVIDLAALGCPLSTRLDAPYCEHDMSVRIMIRRIRIMDRDVGVLRRSIRREHDLGVDDAALVKEYRLS